MRIHSHGRGSDGSVSWIQVTGDKDEMRVLRLTLTLAFGHSIIDSSIFPSVYGAKSGGLITECVAHDGDRNNATVFFNDIEVARQLGFEVDALNGTQSVEVNHA